MVVGLAADLASGIEIARSAIDDGRAEAVLEGLVRVSKEATLS
jgi:anthranilate phosphoribosyltransferase